MGCTLRGLTKTEERTMRYLLGWMLVVCLFVSPAVGQSQLGTGAISGTIQDSTGAVVPDVQVTITQKETGLTRTVQSSASGQFLAPVLPTGTYHVIATKPGFANLDQDNVTVDVGGTAHLQMTLKVGDVSENVTVTAAAESIDTTQTDI